MVRVLNYLNYVYYLCSSVPYRTLNLVIVGGNKKGKTSLARRLSKNKIKSPAPLNEINLLDWKFSLSASTATTTVDFKIWDFPSQVRISNYVHIDMLCTQEQSHTFNYCFYSKQAIFLVVFSIANGKSGIEELDAYLRNIKVYKYPNMTVHKCIYTCRHMLLAVQ